MEGLSLSCRKDEKEKEDHNQQGSIEEEEDDDDMVLMKRRISSHPLFHLLLQTHLQCLKVGGNVVDDELADHDHDHDEEENDNMRNIMQQLQLHTMSNLGEPTKDSDLDHFMEAYCLALGKLKEEMEENQKNSMAFINTMHLQLKDLTLDQSPNQATKLSDPPL